MIYAITEELPNHIKQLPNNSRNIYMKAYNAAWNDYEACKSNTGTESREEYAHRIALSAAKQTMNKKEV
jgi:cation transport regulator